MTYPTVAYPPWSSLDPDPEAYGSEFVETAVAAARDLFDRYYDVHEPERIAIGTVKLQTAYAAAALVDAADGDGGHDQPTWGDVASADGERAVLLAEERGVADEPIEAPTVAIGVYGDVVTSLDWAADEAGVDPNVLCFVHDGAWHLAQAGEELWPDENANASAEGQDGGAA